MKDYSDYTVAEFSVDEYFRTWVLSPNPGNVEFWENLMHNNPALKDTISEAASLILVVTEMSGDDLTDEIHKQEIRKLFVKKQRIRPTTRLNQNILPLIWYKIAAVWLVLVGLGGMYYISVNRHDGRSNPNATLAIANPERLITAKNESGHPTTLLLSDGSIIVLENGTTLRYPKIFEGGVRSVFLTGSAFFDVARNTSKPFLVYSEKTVTKVLGTSFRIESTNEQVLVAVKTGKVSVQTQTNFELGPTAKNEGVLLSPNQQVIYHRSAEQFEKTQVENPLKIISDSDKRELGFEETAVSDIFRALEKNYGIDIVFDEPSFSRCRLTTQFTEETLRQRLQAICEVTGASFAITEGQVTIQGTCE